VGAARVKVTDRGGQTGKSPAAASQPGVKRRAEYRLAAETGVNAREKAFERALRNKTSSEQALLRGRFSRGPEQDFLLLLD